MLRWRKPQGVTKPAVVFLHRKSPLGLPRWELDYSGRVATFNAAQPAVGGVRGRVAFPPPS